MIAIKFNPLKVVVCLFALYAVPAAAQPTELFISEYIEGSSNNKAIEIYNGTAAPVNLGAGGYNIQMFFNGNPVSTLTINLAGTIAPGDVFVLAQSSASATILAQADQTNGSGWFNGDDAVVLRKGTTIIDSIGQVGFDPGSEWGSDATSTADNTLRRKATITAGDPVANNVFSPADEWNGFATDTFTGLGAHNKEPVLSTCGTPLSVPLGTPGTRVVTATDADSTVTSLIINSVTPLPVSGTITMSSVTPAAGSGDTASGTVVVSPTVPVGSYSVQVTATNDDATPQTGTCTLTVNVASVTTYEIWQIQGNSVASPYVGQLVRTENNIVTALGFDEATNAPTGFFIQTPATRVDGSDQTSNGVFVFTGGAPGVTVGDQVDVTASVTEFFGMTELTNATATIDSHGNTLPAAILFSQISPGVFVPSHDQPWPVNELERFEGMLVRVENGRVAAATDRFGDTPIVADSTRPFREPGLLYPGEGGYPTLWDGNPEIFDLNADGAGLPDARLAGGAVIEVAEGPLAFTFGDYQIWPTTLVYKDVALPKPVRARNPGELTIGSQNLFRLFDSDRTNGPDDGAANAAQYPTKLAKASLHIRTVLNAPDVVAIEEVENIGVAEALAARIAADDPSLVYTAYLFEGNDPGGIDTGFLVRDTVSVTSVTQLNPAKIFSFPGVADNELHDRPPLVLTGEYVGNGAPFPITVVGIHNRSLNDIEAGNAAAPRVRQKRLEQAIDIAQFVQAIQTTEPDRRVVLIGDFNAFQFSDGYVDVMGVITGELDPNGAIHPGHVDLVDPNLVDQINSVAAAERYSYVFEASAQVLDHALTTQNLTPYLRGLTIARGNADAPESMRTDPATAVGTSDHDGEVLFIMTDADADGSPDDVDNCSTNPNPNQSDFDNDGTGDVCDEDDDNDGVDDTVDACQTSAPLGLFVAVDACTTDVPDQLLINGCSISESIASIADASWNHGTFVSQAAHLLNDLRKDGRIDNKQRSEIHRCAAWANVP